ncbi:hypothetical protein [Streptomyces nanshensis]|uniref:Uncharacterized protein n=1 Tax=Streptomyces nanshensis TaxID=518642 RepID=A0A1E7L5P1_9ACTN|nr:hypothetical protein [Streptomyces nanshensis]OEV11517.1 hypothetical protein AN218_12495 [Streptomyces nanshensis]
MSPYFCPDDEATSVEVDVHALQVDGETPFRNLPRGTLIRLDEAVLGIPAGLWRADRSYSQSGGAGQRYDCRTLTAAPNDPEGPDAAEALPAHVADGWTSAWPVEVRGMRASELRATLDALA